MHIEDEFPSIAMHARIIHKGSRYVSFEMRTPNKPQLSLLDEVQAQLGYHPNGYGNPESIISDGGDQSWYTLWKCSASCD